MDRWEPWQVMAVFDGHVAANTMPSGPGAPSDEAFRAAVARTMH